MRDYRRFACNILVILVISGCIPQHISPPVDDHTEVPSMQPLADLGINKQPAPVFGSDEEYSGSPLDEVGKRGCSRPMGRNQISSRCWRTATSLSPFVHNFWNR